MNRPSEWLILLPELWLALATLGLLVLDIRKKAKPVSASGAALAVLPVFPMLLWQAQFSGMEILGHMVRVDPLAILFKMIFAGSAMLVLLMSREMSRTLPRAPGEFHLLVLTATLGMFFTASSADFLMLFVSLELIAITFYVLTSYLQTDPRSLEAGMKYLILGSLASGFFLYGVALLYGASGSTQFSAIRIFLQGHETLGPMLLLAFLLILAGICFKMAAVPFQLWVPDVYQGAPTPVTAFLSVGSKAAGFVVALRLLDELFRPQIGQWSGLIAWLAGLTILYGNLGAIPQSNVKRLLGFSSIGHAGYLLIGLASGERIGTLAINFYLVSYLFTNLAVFLVICAFSRQTGSDEIRDYAGLARRSPLLAAALFLSLLSLAGVPPLAGFFGKFLLIMTAVWEDYLWLAGIGAAAVVISLYYYLMLVKVMYVDPPADPAPIPVTFSVRLALYLCMGAMLAIGIWQAPFVTVSSAAAVPLW